MLDHTAIVALIHRVRDETLADRDGYLHPGVERALQAYITQIGTDWNGAVQRFQETVICMGLVAARPDQTYAMVEILAEMWAILGRQEFYPEFCKKFFGRALVVPERVSESGPDYGRLYEDYVRYTQKTPPGGIWPLPSGITPERIRVLIDESRRT